MTVKELYAMIDGDYDKAIGVLRIDKLIDKHIRKLPSISIFTSLFEAEESGDPTALFESAHAIKGVCANLGLIKIADLASEICEEFRPEKTRKLSDAEVSEKVREIERLYDKAVEGIKKYEEETA